MQKIPEIAGQAEQQHVAKELPEYLKQKLRARGILRDGREKKDTAVTHNVSLTLLHIIFLLFALLSIPFLFTHFQRQIPRV